MKKNASGLPGAFFCSAAIRSVDVVGRSNPCSAVTRYRLPFIIGARLFLFVADRSLLAAKRFGTRESRNVFVAFGGAGVMLAAASVF
jgi:hypothetical protein